MIYVIRHQPHAPKGSLKIGYSKRPKARLRDLMNAHPHPDDLELIGCFEGDAAKEKVIHARFSNAAVVVGREWFDRTIEAELLATLGPNLLPALDEIAESDVLPVYDGVSQTGVVTEFVHLDTEEIGQRESVEYRSAVEE